MPNPLVNGSFMELIRGLHNLRPSHHGCVATIGNFDGVHLGHRAIIEQVKRKASELSLPALVMLFEPQPREFFTPDRAPARLMTIREKCEVLASLGVDRVLCIKFNHRFSKLSARAFSQDLLVEKLGVGHLVVGDDFRFGSDRRGNFKLLEQVGAENNFSVEHTATLQWQGARISSTRIRDELERSRFAEAEVLLGQPFFMSGKVIHGQKLGRSIGVPTANILPHRVQTPLSGVFAVEVAGVQQTSNSPTVTVTEPEALWPGVANLGVRPTLGGEQVRLEVHLLDFDGDLYGRHLRVMFRHKLRDEKKFDGLDALIAAINHDIESARHYFTGN